MHDTSASGHLSVCDHTYFEHRLPIYIITLYNYKEKFSLEKSQHLIFMIGLRMMPKQSTYAEHCFTLLKVVQSLLAIHESG